MKMTMILNEVSGTGEQACRRKFAARAQSPIGEFVIPLALLTLVVVLVSVIANASAVGASLVGQQAAHEAGSGVEARRVAEQPARMEFFVTGSDKRSDDGENNLGARDHQQRGWRRRRMLKRAHDKTRVVATTTVAAADDDDDDDSSSSSSSSSSKELLLLAPLTRGQRAKQQAGANLSAPPGKFIEPNKLDGAAGISDASDLLTGATDDQNDQDDQDEERPDEGGLLAEPPALDEEASNLGWRQDAELETLNWPAKWSLIDANEQSVQPTVSVGLQSAVAAAAVAADQQTTRAPDEPVDKRLEVGQHRGSHQHQEAGPQLAVVVASSDPATLAHEAPERRRAKLSSSEKSASAAVGVGVGTGGQLQRAPTNEVNQRALETTRRLVKGESDSRPASAGANATKKARAGSASARDSASNSSSPPGRNKQLAATHSSQPGCRLMSGLEHRSRAFWFCQNFTMAELPSDLAPPPGNLRLANVGLQVLKRNALDPYTKTLRDFSIENAPFLAQVEAHVFANMSRLRVIYILQVPNLENFDFAIVGRNSELTMLRIQQTGLRSWPNLSQFVQERLLTSVDLNDNQIETLGNRPINIRAELLNLEFNRLTSISEHTFNGSEIGTLSLASNRRLSHIHRNAFTNLKNLIKLDLSSTSVSQLPSIGFDHLRTLLIRDNYALRQIPSIYSFPVLEEARLTYSYHCCSFANPQKHDPDAYLEHVRMQNAINDYCSQRIGEQTKSREAQAVAGVSPNDQDAFRSELRRGTNETSNQYISDGPDITPNMALSWTQNSDFEGSFGLPQPAESIDVKVQTSSPFINEPTTTKVAAPTTFSSNSPNAHLPREQAPATSIASETTSATATTTTTTTTTSSPLTNPFDGVMSGGPIEVSAPNQSGSMEQVPLLKNVECGELVLKSSMSQSIICTPEPDAFNPCEDIMGYQILRYLIWLVAFCSLAFNASVFIVHFSIFKRLTVPKFLQLNLALGDFFMGVYLAMLAYEDVTTAGDYFNHAIDWQQGYGCRVAGGVGIFAGQLSIFTLCVITLERFFTILWSIDLSMRLELGWAKGIMFLGWFYSITMALLPALGYANSYSKTSICLPLRNSSTADRAYIGVLFFLVVSAFLALAICYLKMWKLVEKQKSNQAYNQERKVAKRMFTLVGVDFLCWGPIIFFGLTAVFGQPLITVTQSKILIVIFYPLNAMANPFLYVLLTRQYRKDVTYIRNRWNQWRKNLFRRDKDKDYSYNLEPYTNRYPIALNAHLGNVAAATGAANHLHHYKLPINYVNDNGERIELYKVGNGVMEGLDEDTQQDSANKSDIIRNQRGANGLNRAREAGCKGPDGQYIIRHQIIPTKCIQVRTSARTTRFSIHQTASKEDKSRGTNAMTSDVKNQKHEVQEEKKTVKLGHLIDDNERVSTLVESGEFIEVKSHDDNPEDNSNRCIHNRHRQHHHHHHHHHHHRHRNRRRKDSTHVTNDLSTTSTASDKDNCISKNHLLVIDKPHHQHHRHHQHRQQQHHHRHRHREKKQVLASAENGKDSEMKAQSRQVECNRCVHETCKTMTVTRTVLDKTHECKNISYRKFNSPSRLNSDTNTKSHPATKTSEEPEISLTTTSATTSSSTSGVSACATRGSKSFKTYGEGCIANGLHSTIVCLCSLDNMSHLVTLPLNDTDSGKCTTANGKEKRKHRCVREVRHHRIQHHHHHHHRTNQHGREEQSHIIHGNRRRRCRSLAALNGCAEKAATSVRKESGDATLMNQLPELPEAEVINQSDVSEADNRSPATSPETIIVTQPSTTKSDSD